MERGVARGEILAVQLDLRVFLAGRHSHDPYFAGRDALAGLWTRPIWFFGLLKKPQNRFSLPHTRDAQSLQKTHRDRRWQARNANRSPGIPSARLLQRWSCSEHTLLQAALCRGVCTRALRHLYFGVQRCRRVALSAARTAAVISGVRGATLEATTPHKLSPKRN